MEEGFREHEADVAKLPTINFLSNIADTFWIHEPYRIGKMPVK